MEYEGLEIDTSQEVYDPAEDSLLAADVLSGELEDIEEAGLRIIDIGCGTGLLGLYAATYEQVDEVVLVDMNDEAIRLCKSNIQKNADKLHARCTVVKSDLFSKVSGNFNMMVFNAPYLPDKDGSKLSKAWYGGEKGIALSKRFLNEAQSRLEDKGRIILIVSSFGDLEELRREISRLGFTVAEESKIHVSFEDIIALVIIKGESIGS